MSRRYTMLFLFLIALPVLAVMFLLLQSGIQQERAYYEERLINQMAESVEREMQMIYTQTEQFAINPTVRGYLSRTGDFDMQYDEMINLRAQITAFGRNKAVYAIRLFIDGDKFYASDKTNFFHMRDFARHTNFLKAPETPFSGPYTVDYFALADARVVSCAQLVTHESLFMKTVGAVVIDVRTEYLAGLMELGKSLTGVSLKCANGAEIVSLGDAGAGRVYSRALEFTGWTLAACFKTSTWGWLVENTAGLRLSVTLALAAAALLIASILAIRGATVRVERMANAFASAEKGVEDAAPAKRARVFAGLERAERDAQRALIWQREQLRERAEMNYKLLQAQINPHFLYNTLDNIGWLIQAGKHEHASESIIALAKYLRLTLSRGRDEIPLSEEIEMARLYAWMQARKAKLETRFNVEADCGDYLTPKLTLQPIIENAITHGGASVIDVYAYAEDGMLVITVCDNGAGIDAGRLQSIMSVNEARGFGLYSVDQRARLFSGDMRGCGVFAESEPGKYTLFTIKIAARKSS